MGNVFCVPKEEGEVDDEKKQPLPSKEEKAARSTIAKFNYGLERSNSVSEIGELNQYPDDFELSPETDLRLFPRTREAIIALGDSIRYPSDMLSYKEASAWWQTTGQSFSGIMAGWSGDCPVQIDTTVLKLDNCCEDTIRVRVFSPNLVPNDGLPVVLYFHGGGFASGSYKDPAYDNYLMRLASVGKCVVVAANYRLSSEHPYPSSLEDCYTVTKWIVEGKCNGVTAGKVVLAGDSTGANLAFGTCMMATKLEQDLVSGLYFICPLFHGEGKCDDLPSTTEFDGYFLCEGYLRAISSGVTDDKDKWFYNPMLWPLLASSDDLQDFPPCRTVVMQCDMARDMGMAMHERLKVSNVKSTLSVIAGAVHQQQLFTKHSPEVTDESIHDLARFASYTRHGPALYTMG